MLGRTRRTQGLTVALLAAALAAAVPQTAAALPDGRAYEQVSPADKGGAPVYRENGLWTPSVDGNRFLWTSFVPVEGSTTPLAYSGVATRGAHGWTTTQVAPTPVSPHPGSAINGVTPGDATDDLSSVFFWSVRDNFDPDDQTLEDSFAAPGDVYRRFLGGPFSLVSRGNDVHVGELSSEYAGRSADGGHVLFQTQNHLLPVDAPRTDGSGLYDRAGATTVAVDLADDETLLSPCGASIGGAQSAQNAVSEDGSRIFFEVPARDGSGAPPCDMARQVFLRSGADDTVRISRSRLATPEPTEPATFQAASADGDRVLIASPERLVEAAPATATHKLYAYDTEADSLSFVADRVLSVLKASRDGRRYAFVSRDVLAPGGIDGQDNVYLAGPDGFDYLAPSSMDLYQREVLTAIAFSPNGRYVAFNTYDMPGYDTGGVAQVFLFDADAKELSCVSCPPPGVVSAAPARLLPRFGQEYSLRAMLPEVVTDDGAVFFATPDPLVPTDSNGVGDVYQYRDGTRALISKGTGPNPSHLAGASRDGESVFFSTTDSLVAQDVDGGDEDVYVARVGGGFPVPAERPRCEGSQCQGAAQPPLPSPDPGSLRFGGRGDGDESRRAQVRLALSRVVQARLARRGRARLQVWVNGPGRVTVVARRRVGGRYAVAARARTTARRSGSVRLTLRLSRPARRALARQRRMRLRLSVTFADRRQTRTLTLTTGGAR